MIVNGKKYVYRVEIDTMEDVKKLRKLDIYGAIIGKAYYTGAINLVEAVEAAK